MNKPYLILVNNVLASRHATRIGAMRHIAKLQAKGLNAVLAYKLQEAI